MLPRSNCFRENDRRAAVSSVLGRANRLFSELPQHLAKMALFKVNTGCREHEVCDLRWEWEIPSSRIENQHVYHSGESVKNREERLVVFNRVLNR